MIHMVNGYCGKDQGSAQPHCISAFELRKSHTFYLSGIIIYLLLNVFI